LESELNRALKLIEEENAICDDCWENDRRIVNGKFTRIKTWGNTLLFMEINPHVNGLPSRQSFKMKIKSKINFENTELQLIGVIRYIPSAIDDKSHYIYYKHEKESLIEFNDDFISEHKYSKNNNNTNYIF
jgi:hypothetical protein